MAGNELSVSIQPYIHSPLCKSNLFFNRASALLPIMLLAVYNYGVMGFLCLASAASAVVLPAYVALKLKGRRLSDVEYDVYYYAFLYSLILPAGVGIKIAFLGGIIFYFMMFYQQNANALAIFNPAAAVSCLLTLGFHNKMTYYNSPRPFLSKEWFYPFASDVYHNGLLFDSHNFNLKLDSSGFKEFINILSGWHPGHFGEISILLIIAVFIYLAAKKSVDIAPTLGAFAGLGAAVACLYFKSGFFGALIEFFHHAFGSMFLFYSCFLVNDYFSTPPGYYQRFFFGALFGALVAAIDFKSSGVDNVNFALMMTCSIMPVVSYYSRRALR